MTVLSLDYETRSKTDLFARGLYAYARDPSTRVLMAAYAIDDGPVELWQPHMSPKPPADLRDAMRDPAVTKRAWNVNFESEITEHTLGLRIDNWIDTMVMALYASLPGKLEFAGPALGLPEEMCKMPEGKRLIRKFSLPKADGTFRDWSTDEDDWELFCDYCKRDVTVEREIARRLASIKVPDSEWELWRLDQKINRRGLPVDLDFVRSALAMGAAEKQRLINMLKRETGLSNPMTQAGFLDWARSHGYPYNNLQKGTVARAMREGEMDAELVRMMSIRGDAAKTSIRKYDSVLAKTQDDRLYNTVQFYGASRTGRWAGRDPQVQNFPRPINEIEGHEERFTDMVKAGQYDDILLEFGGAMPVLSSLTRSSFRAPEGRIFHIADLNAIENRVLGWVTGCQPILDVFLNDLDPYKAFGSKMFRKPYEEITKAERTISKPAVLGCGYRLGGGDEVEDKNGDLILTGLWGYAASMGISMTREQAHESVKVFRAAYPEVVQYWYDVQNAAHECVVNCSTVRVGCLVFNGSPNLMRVRLPSGRDLHYIRPRIEKLRTTFSKQVPDGMNDDGTPRFKTVSEVKLVSALTYEGMHQKTKKWCRLSTHGGKLTENFVQAIARDVLAAGLLKADKIGYDIVLHAHDEIVAETDVDDLLTPDDLAAVMAEPLPWAPGLPLKAVGLASTIYRK